MYPSSFGLRGTVSRLGHVLVRPVILIEIPVEMRLDDWRLINLVMDNHGAAA